VILAYSLSLVLSSQVHMTVFSLFAFISTYTQYLEGLASSQKLTGKEINKRSDAILEKMKSGDNALARPNRFTYISAMKCRARLLSDADDKNDDITDEHVKLSGMEYVKNVESLLRELESIYNETGDKNLDPNAFCYVPIANAAARCRGGIEAARHAESLMWELLEKFKKTNEYDHKPVDGMYTAVLTAYARVDPEDAEVACQRVRILLKEINDNLNRHRPTNFVYTAAINVLVIDPSAENLKEAEAILKRMPVDSVAYQCGKCFFLCCKAHLFIQSLISITYLFFSYLLIWNACSYQSFCSRRVSRKGN